MVSFFSRTISLLAVGLRAMKKHAINASPRLGNRSQFDYTFSYNTEGPVPSSSRHNSKCLFLHCLITPLNIIYKINLHDDRKVPRDRISGSKILNSEEDRRKRYHKLIYRSPLRYLSKLTSQLSKMHKIINILQRKLPENR